jgi:hypothetical protein
MASSTRRISFSMRDSVCPDDNRAKGDARAIRMVTLSRVVILAPFCSGVSSYSRTTTAAGPERIRRSMRKLLPATHSNGRSSYETSKPPRFVFPTKRAAPAVSGSNVTGSIPMARFILSVSARTAHRLAGSVLQ